MTAGIVDYPATFAPRLPDGFVVTLKRKVRVDNAGAALLGGFPTRALYLTTSAQQMLRDRTVTVTSAPSAVLARRLLDAGFADPDITELPDFLITAVTVVIPVYDRPDQLDRLLASIASRIQVIVVDDASPDPSRIAAVVQSHHAQLIRLERNSGPAAARNAGMREVRSPYVAFVDSDMVLDPLTIPTLLRHFHDPRVALVAPRVIGLRDDRTNWVSRYEDARSALDIGRSSSLVRPRTMVAWLPAACMVARISALGDGFSSDMRVAEDVDLVWRLDAAGWHVRYEPNVYGYHEHRTDLREWALRRMFYGTGADLLANRHPEQVAPAIFAPWTATFVMALLAQRKWSVPVAVSAASIAAAHTAHRLHKHPRPVRHAVRLTSSYAIGAAFQVNALLLRHWWPVTVIGCVVSRRLRRATLWAMVADLAVEWGRTRPELDPARFALLRRLEDLAYGAGLWSGAIRGRSLRSLLPSLVRHSRPSRRTTGTSVRRWAPSP